MNRPRLASLLFVALLSGPAAADFPHEWIATIGASTGQSVSLSASVVDPAGVTYVTGPTGTSSNGDIYTAAVDAGGNLLWSHTYDGVQAWHDQARGITLGPGGVVWVCGNTPGPGHYADVMLLKYDALTGALLTTVQYATQPFKSEHAASCATDSAGNVFIAGGTVGDGGDVLVVKFDAAGVFQWNKTWDGPCLAPYSQDHGDELLIDSNGDALVRIHGVMSSLHPDYVVVKYDGASGATLWEANWGGTGGDFASDMELDAAGDVIVTGKGLTTSGEQIATVKWRGSDGLLLWEVFDQHGTSQHVRGLALDADGDVYVAASTDPDFDDSNSNNDMFVAKHAAINGGLLWEFEYGADCIGCGDYPSDLVVDSSGRLFVGGYTDSPPYPGNTITFALDSLTGLELDRDVLAGPPNEHAGSGLMALDAAENLYNAAGIADPTSGQGRISILKYPTLDPSWENYCISAPNSLGAGALIHAAGSASVAANVFQLSVTDAAANQIGIFFYGPDENLFPFGEGWRCFGGGAFRLGPPQATNPSGFATRAMNFDSAPANAGPGEITGGSRWHFQFWYRDPAGGGTAFNLSDGLRVDFLP